VPYTDVASAVVQVEFGSGEDAETGEDADTDAARSGRRDGGAALAAESNQSDVDEEIDR
jgi:hypothetical protein